MASQAQYPPPPQPEKPAGISGRQPPRVAAPPRHESPRRKRRRGSAAPIQGCGNGWRSLPGASEAPHRGWGGKGGLLRDRGPPDLTAALAGAAPRLEPAAATWPRTFGHPGFPPGTQRLPGPGRAGSCVRTGPLRRESRRKRKKPGRITWVPALACASHAQRRFRLLDVSIHSGVSS